MAESKLGIYQLGYAQQYHNSLGVTKAGAIIRKVGKGAEKVIETTEKGLQYANRLADMYGNFTNVYNRFANGGKVQDENGNNVSKAQFDELMKLVQINQTQGKEAAVQYVVQKENNNNNQLLEAILKKADDNKKDNTALYVGLGVGGLLLFTMMFMMMNKK